MEVTEALRVPLAPARVWPALSDLALLRASLDNCESFTRTPNGEYALTLVVPLGALRARYDTSARIWPGALATNPLPATPIPIRNRARRP